MDAQWKWYREHECDPGYGYDTWNEEELKRVQAMIPEVEGKPCVLVGGLSDGIYVCRRISGLGTDGDSFNGECDWVDPAEARTDEVTDGMSISKGCIRLGPGWWQDTYFGWYFVYDPTAAARSLAGDHNWVAPFLAAVDIRG